jgi:O-antigen/teichoic acid export membrane protein
MNIPKVSEYSKNILTLISGVAIAQTIPIAITPLLTRLYSPNDFGVYGTYLASVSILAIIATGKYDVAIIHPNENSDADQLFILSTLISASFCTLLYVSLAIGYSLDLVISEFIRNNKIIFLIPLSVFLLSLNNAVQLLLNRRKIYKQMRANRIAFSLLVGFLALILGYIKIGFAGLAISHLLGQAFVLLFIIWKYWQTITKVDYTRISELAREYKKYPFFALPSGLSNASAIQMPIILITKFFDSMISGYYYLVEKVLTAPISLIGASVSSVFRQRAQEEFHTNGIYRKIFISTAKRLSLIGVVPFAIIGFYGPEIFSYVFGDKWTQAGSYAQILAPMFFIKFTVSPLLSSFYVSNKLKIDMYFQFIFALIVMLSIFVGNYLNNITVLISLLSASGSIIYLSLFIIAYSLSSQQSLEYGE